MNEGEYVTEGTYATPLPRTDVERQLWKLVIAISKALTVTPGSTRRSEARTSSLRSSYDSLPPRTDPSSAQGRLDKRSTNSHVVFDGTRLLAPLAAYLESLTVNRAVHRVGASVVDVVVQLPDVVVRREALRLVLSFPKLCFDMCGPVSVAASRGDVASIKSLLHDRRLDPNCGFPLTLAVRHHQLEALQLLLTSRRIRPNHGSAFFEAVARRDMACIELLIRHAHLNVNRFAKNRGTTPLLHAMRGFMQEVPADGSAPSPRPDPLLASPHDDRHDLLPALVITAPPLGPRRRSTSSLNGLSNTARVHCVPVSPQSAHHSPWPAALPCSERPASRQSSPPQTSLSSFSDCPLDSARLSRSVGGHGRIPGWTPASWREVLTYLLQHPAVDVNSGFYATPLMIAILAEHGPLVSLLLSFAHVKPNRLNPSVKALTAAMHHFKHMRSNGVVDYIGLLVRTPLEATLERRTVRGFELLVRDRRVLVPQSVWQRLEQHPDAAWAIPFLEILARYRTRWESWAWRWRRACLVAAQLSAALLTVLHWWFLTAWATEFGKLHAVTAGVVTVLMVPVGMWCLLARSTPCAALPEAGAEAKPSTDALVTIATACGSRCGLSPSVFRWLLWFSLVCAPLVPLWPLYSAFLTAQLGCVARGPWRQVDPDVGSAPHSHPGEEEAASTSVVVVALDGLDDNRPPPSSPPAWAARDYHGAQSTDEDARSMASSVATTRSVASTSGTGTGTGTGTGRHGDDSCLSAVSSARPGDSDDPSTRRKGSSWGSAHLMHAVRRLSHHRRRQSQDSDASASTQFTEAAHELLADGEAEEDGTRVPAAERLKFMLPQASVVPSLSLRAALYGLYDRLMPTNALISAMGFMVHLNFLFPFRNEKDKTPSVLDAHNRTLLIVAGLTCFLCSLVEFTALLTSWLCLQNASPASLLSGSARTFSRRPANTRHNLLL